MRRPGGGISGGALLQTSAQKCRLFYLSAHMSSIQAKYFNRDEEGKSGTKMRCGVQVEGSPGVRSSRHRRKNAVYFTYPLPRIAYLAFRPGPCTDSPPCEGLAQGLRELGYVKGQNLSM